uniref:RRM domain-containing protein n=1 Tax=Clastoptera arizonana TaxID=38151 RepID=A0A1B6EDT9_9HEMI
MKAKLASGLQLKIKNGNKKLKAKNKTQVKKKENSKLKIEQTGKTHLFKKDGSSVESYKKNDQNITNPLFLKRERNVVKQNNDTEEINKTSSGEVKEKSNSGTNARKSQKSIKKQNIAQNLPITKSTPIGILSPNNGLTKAQKKKNRKRKSKLNKISNTEKNKPAKTSDSDEGEDIDISKTSTLFNKNQNEENKSNSKTIDNGDTDSDPNESQEIKSLMIENDSLEHLDEESTIFVGNLPKATKKKDLIKFFRKYGKILSVRFRGAMQSDPRIPKKVAVITQDFHKDMDSINAYIVYKEKFEARNALEASGCIFNNHHLRVDYANPKKERNTKQSVFVGNLPYVMRDEELWEAFKDCGDIESVRVVREHSNRLSKGFGYVNFKNADSVELALQMEDVTIQNKKLRVARAVDPKIKNPTDDNKSRKRKFNTDPKIKDLTSIPEEKKLKTETLFEGNNVALKKSTKREFQGQKSAQRKLKKQILKKKAKKKTEKVKKSVAKFLMAKKVPS